MRNWRGRQDIAIAAGPILQELLPAVDDDVVEYQRSPLALVPVPCHTGSELPPYLSHPGGEILLDVDAGPLEFPAFLQDLLPFLVEREAGNHRRRLGFGWREAA